MKLMTIELSCFSCCCSDNIHLAGSFIGSPAQLADVLKFVGDHNIKARTRRVSMKDANGAIKEMNDQDGRYRYILVNEALVNDDNGANT